MCSLLCIAVKGAWSCWSSWSQCSVGCGGGHYQRTRTCSSPAPANGGDICMGLHTEEALCNTHTCDGKEASPPRFCFFRFKCIYFLNSRPNQRPPGFSHHTSGWAGSRLLSPFKLPVAPSWPYTAAAVISSR